MESHSLTHYLSISLSADSVSKGIFKSTAAAVSWMSNFNWHCQYAVADIQMWQCRTYFNFDKGRRLLPRTTRRMLDDLKPEAFPEPLIVYKYSAVCTQKKKRLWTQLSYSLKKYVIHFKTNIKFDLERFTNSPTEVCWKLYKDGCLKPSKLVFKLFVSSAC